MKKNHLLYKAALLLTIISVSLSSCKEKEYTSITPGTTWMHPAAGDEFYHYWKDSTFPCIRKLNERTHTIHALKVRYCPCLFPVYYEMDVSTSFSDNTKKIYPEDVTGVAVFTKLPDNWPAITIASAPWNE